MLTLATLTKITANVNAQDLDLLAITARRTPAQAMAEVSRTGAHLAGWRVAGRLSFERRGFMLRHADGRWTLYRKSVCEFKPAFTSSYLIACIDAAATMGH